MRMKKGPQKVLYPNVLVPRYRAGADPSRRSSRVSHWSFAKRTVWRRTRSNPPTASVRGEKAIVPRLCYLSSGVRLPSSVFWSLVSLLGGFCFSLLGVASFLNVGFLFFSRSLGVAFVPQGATLLFYGVVGLTLGLFIGYGSLAGTGSALDVFDEDKRSIFLIRRSFGGKLGLFSFMIPFADVLYVSTDLEEATVTISFTVSRDSSDGTPRELYGTSACRGSFTVPFAFGAGWGYPDPLQLQELAVKVSRLLNVPMWPDRKSVV